MGLACDLRVRVCGVRAYPCDCVSAGKAVPRIIEDNKANTTEKKRREERGKRNRRGRRSEHTQRKDKDDRGLTTHCTLSLTPAMLPLARTSRRVYLRTANNTTMLRRRMSVFEERENALESMTVKKHDQELLEKLRQAELAKEKAEARAKVNT